MSSNPIFVKKVVWRTGNTYKTCMYVQTVRKKNLRADLLHVYHCLTAAWFQKTCLNEEIWSRHTGYESALEKMEGYVLLICSFMILCNCFSTWISCLLASYFQLSSVIKPSCCMFAASLAYTACTTLSPCFQVKAKGKPVFSIVTLTHAFLCFCV